MPLAIGMGLGPPFIQNPLLPPSFFADFLSETPRSSAPITYSGGANGTRVNSAGLIVAASCPRIDYDPVTLAVRGLLVEEQRTNLEPQSGNVIVAGGYTPTGATLTRDLTAPDGAENTASTLQASAGAGGHFFVGNSVSFTTGLNYVLSVRVRAGTVNRIQLTGAGGAFGTTLYANFSLTGQGSVLAQAGLVAAGISAGSGGWYWCWIVAAATATVAAASAVVAFIDSDTATRIPGFTAAGTETVGVWGVQTEAGAFPTSYIPTTGSAVTRTADVAQCSGANFSAWYNPIEWSAIAEYMQDMGLTPGSTTPQPFTISDNTLNNRVQLQAANRAIGNAVLSVVHRSGGVIYDWAGGGGSSINDLNIRKSGVGIRALDNVATNPPGVVQTNATAIMPIGVDRMYIGANASGTASGRQWIRRILYWNQRLPNATLQALTA